MRLCVLRILTCVLVFFILFFFLIFVEYTCECVTLRAKCDYGHLEGDAENEHYFWNETEIHQADILEYFRFFDCCCSIALYHSYYQLSYNTMLDVYMEDV